MTVKFLISYRTRPVQIFGLWGLLMGFVGLLICGWLGYVRLFAYQSIADRPILLLGILLVFTGVQLVTLGLLAEMQARTCFTSPRTSRLTSFERSVRATRGRRMNRGRRQAPCHEALQLSPSSRRSGRGSNVGSKCRSPITAIQREFGSNRSRRQRYADLVIGQPGLWPLVRYELTILLAAWIPGALGLFLRSKLYPLILGRVGRNVAFGCNVVLRHPHKIQIADDVVVDDNCCLDAKGTTNHGIVIRRGVFLPNTILSCKNGDILLDEDANLGFNVEVYSAANVRDWPQVLVAVSPTWLAAFISSIASMSRSSTRWHGPRHRGRRQRA